METHIMVVKPFGQDYSGRVHRLNCHEVMAVVRELMGAAESELQHASTEWITIFKRTPLLASDPRVAVNMQYTFFRAEDKTGCSCAKFTCNEAAAIVRAQPGRAWPGAQEFLLSI